MGLDQQRLVGGQRSAQLQGELEHNQAQFSALASQKEYILSQLAEAAEATRREEQSLASLQSQHDHSRAFLEKSYNDLTLGIRNFLWLGLDLQKAPGNSMRFVFTQVDPKTPAREFSFQMFVDESDTYQLLDCSPALPSTTLAQIMNTLNQDNDITRFTVSMRREFVRHM